MNPAWTIIASFVGALLTLVLPLRMESLARWVALAAATTGLVASVLLALCHLDNPGQPAWTLDVPWIPELGIRFHLAAPGLSLVLMVLTGIVAVGGVLYSWNVHHRTGTFFTLFLTIIGGVYGVFLSRDAFLLFVFYEVVILPKYFLIAVWGGHNKAYGAMKLTIYSIASSAMVLLGLGAAYAVSGTGSFDLATLAAAKYPLAFQLWAFPLLCIGFGVLAGLWPFHTWAPTGHTAAPTAASMLLAGVVMKLGAYGILMVAIPLFPDGFAYWRTAMAVLAVIGIVHGAFTALTRKDLKFIIAYSSVSHMGFILLGLATATAWGYQGAVLQMISHGIIAGLLFGIAGRIVYDRVHVRDLTALAEHDLWNRLPGAVVAFALASAASMGMPGFSGFVAELMVLIGVWSAFPKLIPVLVVAIVVTGIFSLRALNRAFLPKTTVTTDDLDPLPAITRAEIAATVLLLATSLAIGLYPKPWLDLIADGLTLPLLP